MRPYVTKRADLEDVTFIDVLDANRSATRCWVTDIFERRRKYGVPVWMSRHPELNEYICQVKPGDHTYAELVLQGFFIGIGVRQ